MRAVCISCRRSSDLGAPHWDAYARGLLIGMTRDTTIGHVARATVDAMAYQSADVLNLMQEEANLKLKTLKVDGGASANTTLLQFQADLLNVPVRRPVVAETTALGAAYLAGLAVGYWKDFSDVASNWALDREFTPNMEAEKREKLVKGMDEGGPAIARSGPNSRIAGRVPQQPAYSASSASTFDITTGQRYSRSTYCWPCTPN